MSDLTLYTQLGGTAAITAVVDCFYKKVLADERILHFFAKVNMADQAQKQVTYIEMVTGGPVTYAGKGMREAHKGLNIQEHQFMVENLIAALHHFEVPRALIDQLIGTLAKSKNAVLNI